MENLPSITSDVDTLGGASLRGDLRSRIKTLAGLFKLRIVVLLLISALGGAILGAGGWPGMQALTLVHHRRTICGRGFGGQPISGTRP